MKFETDGGIAVTKAVTLVDFETANRQMIAKLDSHKDVYLASNYEYPGRYNR